MRKKIVYLVCFLCCISLIATSNNNNKKGKVLTCKTRALVLPAEDESAPKEDAMELWPVNRFFLSLI